MKPSKLEGWSVWGDRVVGNVHGDNRFADGTFIQTSAIVELDRENKILKTKNSTYELGEEHDYRNQG
jgi:hypothetical protein